MHRWELAHFLRFFPQRPQQIYLLMKNAGFSPSGYRNSWFDLKAGLPSDEWSAKHFIQFSELEVKLPRRFPINLNFTGLAQLAHQNVVNKAHLASVLRNLVQAQIDYDTDCIKNTEFWVSTFEILSEIGTPIIFMGDSHSRLFRQTVKRRERITIPLDILCGGGSAIGLQNKQSRSGYGSLLAEVVRAINQAKTVQRLAVPLCFNFGQVDTEFVHTYRRLKNGQFDDTDAGFEEFCAHVAKSYVGWISELPTIDGVVVGINPPCLSDEYIVEAYLIQMQVYLQGGAVDIEKDDNFQSLAPQFRKMRFPNKITRTKNHILFNKYLHTEAAARGFKYFDSVERLLGPSGCILPIYASAVQGIHDNIGADGKDIHIGGKYAMKIQGDLINRIGKAFIS
jgi:hypothetical protein